MQESAASSVSRLVIDLQPAVLQMDVELLRLLERLSMAWSEPASYLRGPDVSVESLLPSASAAPLTDSVESDSDALWVEIGAPRLDVRLVIRDRASQPCPEQVLVTASGFRACTRLCHDVCALVAFSLLL